MAQHNTIKTQLIKPNYDNEELIKAIDINVDELIPESATIRFDLVPREDFDRVVTDNNDLSGDLAELQTQFDQLEADFISLQSDNQQLQIQTDQALQNESIIQNQSASIQAQFQQLNIDFREALQKSIQEGLNRLSLQAQNDGLRAEVNALRSDISTLESRATALEDRLEGREADIGQGGKLLGQDVTILNLQDGSARYDQDVRYEVNQSNISGGKFVSGREFQIRNIGSDSVIIDVTQSAPGSGTWMRFSPSTLNLNPEETMNVRLNSNDAVIDDMSPTRKAFTSAKNYDGSLIFTIRETGQQLTFSTRLRKRRD